jgi:hypothetical protein
VCRGESLFDPLHVEHPAFKVNLRQLKAARFRNPQAVPEHQEQKATVAGLFPAALGGDYELGYTRES